MGFLWYITPKSPAMKNVIFRRSRLSSQVWLDGKSNFGKEDIAVVIGDRRPDTELDPMANATGPVREFSIEATAEVVKDQLKRGKAGRWEVICDEDAQLGGFDVAPTPLQYIALGVLF